VAHRDCRFVGIAEQVREVECGEPPVGAFAGVEENECLRVVQHAPEWLVSRIRQHLFAMTAGWRAETAMAARYPFFRSVDCDLRFLQREMRQWREPF